MDQEPRNQCNANGCVSLGGNKLTTIKFYLYPTTSGICNSCIWTKRGWKRRRRSQRSCRASVENCLLESSALTYFQTICRWQLLPFFISHPSLKVNLNFTKKRRIKHPGVRNVQRFSPLTILSPLRGEKRYPCLLACDPVFEKNRTWELM